MKNKKHTKICIKCGEEKPICRFPISREKPAGTCKDCVNDYVYERKWKNKTPITGFTGRQYRELKEQGLKYCHCCKEVKSIDEFTKTAKHCKICMGKKSKEANKKHRRRIKNRRLTRVYGITMDDYDRMLLEQKGGCAICGFYAENGILNVDHDHETNKVRGLLCHHCNTAIGFLRENPKLCDKINDYLEKHETPLEFKIESKVQ